MADRPPRAYTGDLAPVLYILLFTALAVTPNRLAISLQLNPARFKPAALATNSASQGLVLPFAISFLLFPTALGLCKR
jgi:hypothetical protein